MRDKKPNVLHYKYSERFSPRPVSGKHKHSKMGSNKNSETKPKFIYRPKDEIILDKTPEKECYMVP